jgi:hypothetical protein
MMMMMMMMTVRRRRRRGRGKQKGGSADVDGDDDDDNEKTFQWVDVYIGEMFVAEDRPGDIKLTSQQGGEELPPPCGATSILQNPTTNFQVPRETQSEFMGGGVGG